MDGFRGCEGGNCREDEGGENRGVHCLRPKLLVVLGKGKKQNMDEEKTMMLYLLYLLANSNSGLKRPQIEKATNYHYDARIRVYPCTSE
jgi:hypothetical protein